MTPSRPCVAVASWRSSSPGEPVGSVVVAALTRLGADLVADEVYLVRLPLDWGKKAD